MCGINGIIGQGQASLQEMNRLLKHRGPNGTGDYKEKNVQLGHTRLAIIDLTKQGHQPMSYSKEKGAASAKWKPSLHKTNNIIITFNGEIYNYIELREKLEKKDYIFTTRTDTEVLLAAYIEWGDECVHQLNGMWAFCIYDKIKQRLFISRDRLGQKPLIYTKNENEFLFSSEIKSILPQIKNKELDSEAFEIYLSCGNIPAPYTPYKKIKKLPAGYNLIYDLKRNTISTKKYYKIPEYKPTYNKNYLIKKAERILLDSAKIRSRSDVQAGSFLSGGLDSSFSAQFLARNKKYTIHTFGTSLQNEFDEIKSINKVSTYLKTKQHVDTYNYNDNKKFFDKVAYYYDEPQDDSAIYPLYSLLEKAKKHITVIFSGDGGDEIFGGYKAHKIAYQLHIFTKITKIIPLKFFEIINKLFGNKKLATVINIVKNDGTTIFDNNRDKQQFKSKSYKDWKRKETKELIQASKGNKSNLIELSNIFTHPLPNRYLEKADRIGMAHQMEIRSPFLDYRLIELSQEIPTKYKHTLFAGKFILRKVLEKYLPKSITNRKKQGYGSTLNKKKIEKEYKQEIEESISFLSTLSPEIKTYFKKTSKEYYLSKYSTRLLMLYFWKERWIEKNK